MEILEGYTDKLRPKSVDEFVLNLEGSLVTDLKYLGLEIKKRIKEEIGEWLTVSVGVGHNSFLAKTAAGLVKPDGLEIIDSNNFMEIYEGLELMDLYGINTRLDLRLRMVGIETVQQMYDSPIQKLKEAFRSVSAYYWFLKIRGWEVEEPWRLPKSFGHTYSLSQKLSTTREWMGVLAKLSEKASFRMRKAGMLANGVTVVVSFRDGGRFLVTRRLEKSDGDLSVIGGLIENSLVGAPQKMVRNLAITYHDLSVVGDQEELLKDLFRRKKVLAAVDSLKNKWGEWIVTPARMIGEKDSAPDAISFGSIR